MAEPSSNAVKQCCANLYGSELAHFLLGESFHPGGLALTQRLAALLALAPGACLLDVACGRGASALFLAERFACRVTGLDFSAANVAAAQSEAARRDLAHRTVFRQADAERLPFPDASFDAILCECALCTFLDKAAAAREFARVLRPGGAVGLSDVTRSEAAAAAAEHDLPSWAACLAGALPATVYSTLLAAAGLHPEACESHDGALLALAHVVRTRLLAAEIATKLGKLTFDTARLQSAKDLLSRTELALQHTRFGYVLLCARKET